MGLSGGICNRGTLTLVQSTVHGNSGPVVGGIINSGLMQLVESTVSGNDSFGFGSGGGISNGGELIVINSTVRGNRQFGDGDGGSGIFNGSRGTIRLRNSTVTQLVAFRISCFARKRLSPAVLTRSRRGGHARRCAAIPAARFKNVYDPLRSSFSQPVVHQ